MYEIPEIIEFKKLINSSNNIVIIQADNPDGDSLGSALALEEILSTAANKNVFLYCAVDMPLHLHYMLGWDRVSNELPPNFDLSIVVDTSALSLLEKSKENGDLDIIKNKKMIVLDHHKVENTLTFATLIINYPLVATGELIYELATRLKWKLTLPAQNAIAISILSDSLGLMSVATTARSIHIIAELVSEGVDLAALENLRRNTMRKSPEIIHYKGELLQRIEYFYDNRIATIVIPWEEIERYSAEYNPSVLALDEMRMTKDTQVAIAFKYYKGERITGKIRCNYGVSIAGKLAEHFGGGGHPYASGFKVNDGRTLDEIKNECISLAYKLLEEDHASN